MDTALKLNNQGIHLLDKGDYKGAALLFHRSFCSLKVISIESNNKDNRMKCGCCQLQQSSKQCNTRDTESAVVQQRQSSSSSSSNDNDDMTATTRSTRQKKRKQPREEHHADKSERKMPQTTASRKRQRLQGATPTSRASSVDDSVVETTTPTTTLAASLEESTTTKDYITGNPLGRPLWLEPSTASVSSNKKKKLSQGVINAYGSSILYNYAYSLQRLGTCQQQRCRPRILQEAINTYSKAIRLSAPSSDAGSLVARWMCCHNLQMLLRTIGGSGAMNAPTVHAAESKSALVRRCELLEAQKTQLLRSIMACTPPSTWPDQSCLLVLSMLGIEGNERSQRSAAAA